MMPDSSNPFRGYRTLGVLGGAGPLASAAFLNTLYQQMAGSAISEQTLPKIVLLSDPSLPDRSKIISSGRSDSLSSKLFAAIAHFEKLDVSHVLICCYTLYGFLPEFQSRNSTIVSLPEIALNSIQDTSDRLLLLCASGARTARVFEHLSSWTLCQERIQFPGQGDQERIDAVIYRLKRGAAPIAVIPEFDSILARYRVTGLLLGCTELHLLTSELKSRYAELSIVDPLLTTIALLKQAIRDNVGRPVPASQS